MKQVVFFCFIPSHENFAHDISMIIPRTKGKDLKKKS